MVAEKQRKTRTSNAQTARYRIEREKSQEPHEEKEEISRKGMIRPGNFFKAPLTESFRLREYRCEMHFGGQRNERVFAGRTEHSIWGNDDAA